MADHDDATTEAHESSANHVLSQPPGPSEGVKSDNDSLFGNDDEDEEGRGDLGEGQLEGPQSALVESEVDQNSTELGNTYSKPLFASSLPMQYLTLCR